MSHHAQSGESWRRCCNQAQIILMSGVISLSLLVAAQAQVITIPKEGLPGLSKEAQDFEIEHNYRRENNLGGTVPAEEGTLPGSSDPHNIEGIWLRGRTYQVNADGSYTLATDKPAVANTEQTSAKPAAEPIGSNNLCMPRLQFAMGMPSKIIQTDRVMYILRNGQDGATYRRINMDVPLPDKVTPSIMGYSVGRWQGDTLIVETMGVQTPAQRAYGDNLAYTVDSKITERIRKIEGGLKLEDVVSVATPGQAEVKQIREVSFYRPDLQYVEAPCEEYSDPFEGQYPNSQ